MQQLNYLLEQQDIDFIRTWIAEGKYDAAEYFLNRSYIPEHITPAQQNDLDALRKELSKAVEEPTRLVS